MLSRFLSILFCVASMHCSVDAQELNCLVDVNTSKVQGTNKALFEALTDGIKGYMNTTKFSNAQIAPNERVECRLLLTINEYEGGRVKGELQVQSSRPVYNSSYNTTVLNFKDQNIEFDYQEGDPLTFNEHESSSNLTSILDYYAYLILALDFDTFSPNGGQPYYDRAQAIVNRAQSSGETGWKNFEDTRNRSALLNAFTDLQTSGLREILYMYHRSGLDQMSLSQDKGRHAITESIKKLGEVYKAQPMSVGLSIVKDAKLDELANIYSVSTSGERQTVAKILADIYPTEQERINLLTTPRTDI